MPDELRDVTSDNSHIAPGHNMSSQVTAPLATSAHRDVGLRLRHFGGTVSSAR